MITRTHSSDNENDFLKYGGPFREETSSGEDLVAEGQTHGIIEFFGDEVAEEKVEETEEAGGADDFIDEKEDDRLTPA